MNAKTLITIGLVTKSVPVDLADFISQRQNAQNRKNAQFMLWHKGVEVIVTASELSQILPQSEYNKVLAESGSFAIVQGTLVAILEA